MPSAKGQDQTNATTGAAWGNTYNADASSTLGQVQPFLQNELTDPQGLGSQTVDQMKTQAGESAAGGVGQAKEAGMLNASRTGNTAAIPGIIDAASRGAMQTETGAANNVDIQNAMLKNQQQQAGAGGLEDIYGQELGASLKSLGLSNTAAQNEETAQQGDWKDALGIVGAAASLGTAGAGAYSAVENA